MALRCATTDILCVSLMRQQFHRRHRQYLVFSSQFKTQHNPSSVLLKSMNAPAVHGRAKVHTAINNHYINLRDH